jgi:hypothetical protein
MDPKRFDRITRSLVNKGSSRRSVLRGFSALAAGSMAALGLGPAARFAKVFAQTTDSEEKSVLLYERIAEIAHEHHGTCEELQLSVREFLLDYDQEFVVILEEQRAWPSDQRLAHAEKYEDRRIAASERIATAFARCSYVTDPNATPEASPVAALGSMRAFRQDPATPVPDNGTPPSGSTPASGDGGETPHLGSMFDCPDKYVMCYQAWEGAPNLGANVGRMKIGTCSENHVGGKCVNCRSQYDHSCSMHFPDVCWKPDYPGAKTGQNFCAAKEIDQDHCDCSETCPISTADCAFFAGGGGAGSTCSACWTAMCGSTDRCMLDCKSNSCCDSPCNSSYVPPPPAGP